MPVPGFLSQFADKAQNALNNSSISQHIPASISGRLSPGAQGDSSASSTGGFKQNHTLETIQHQFRQIQQSYSATGPVQKIITSEKGLALDFDSANRSAQLQSKELYLWGQNEDADVKDVSDRLAFLNYLAGALSNTLATKLNSARTPLKALRDNEAALSARRNARAGLQSQISRIEHAQERGYEKRIAELKDQLAKAERDDDPSEKEHEILKRKALRESEELKFAALREYGEKLSLLSQASEAILTVLPSIPPTPPSSYSGTEQTGTIRATLQHALDNWKPGQTTLSSTAGGANLDRSHTRSFGETHAKELSAINTTDAPSPRSTPPQGVVSPSSPPVHPGLFAIPSERAATAQTAQPVPAPAPIPVQSLGAPTSPLSSSRPFGSATSPVNVPGKSFSPAINPAELNNSPAAIPAASPPPIANPNPDVPETKVPSVTPTVAETGVPVAAGEAGPGPASGSLHDIRASTSTSPRRASASLPYGVSPDTALGRAPSFGQASGYETAEQEKARLAQGGAAAGASAGASAAPTYKSAEDEKREARERLLRGDNPPGPQGGSDAPPDESTGDTPPPYQDM